MQARLASGWPGERVGAVAPEPEVFLEAVFDAVVVLPVGELRAAVDDLQLADADVAVDDQALDAAAVHRAAPPVDVEAAAVAVEHAGVAGADAHVGGDADVVGHDHAHAADADVELERRAAGRQVDLGEVDAQLAHAELVAVAQLVDGGGLVVALADAAVDVDAGRGDEAERDGEDQRGQHEPAAAAHERRHREGGADRDHEPGDHRAAAGGGADHDGEEADERDEEQQQAEADLGGGVAFTLVAARGAPQQHADEADQRDRDQRRREEEQTRTDQDQRGERQHDPARDRRGAAAVGGLLARQRVGGHEQPGGDVAEHAGAAGERQHDEPDPEDDRIDVEVAAEAAGDAAQHAVGAGAGQLPRPRARGHRLRGRGRGLLAGRLFGLLGRGGSVGHRMSPVRRGGGRSAGCRTSAAAPIGNCP